MSLEDKASGCVLYESPKSDSKADFLRTGEFEVSSSATHTVKGTPAAMSLEEEEA